MTKMKQSRVTILPDHFDQYTTAVTSVAGAVLVPPGQDTEVLIWSRHGSPSLLAEHVKLMPHLKFVQLPSAGVENFIREGFMSDAIVWASAKGAYAQPVAEHALALTLTCLRVLHERSRATSWGEQRGRSLYGLNVGIVGAGGIAQEITRLLQPFGCHITICRRAPEPVDFAHVTLGFHDVAELAKRSNVLILACPLTPETSGLISQSVLMNMKEHSVLVNVGRGGVLDTAALRLALDEGKLAAVGLDVTEPEPLPQSHWLWTHPKVLVTPHTADTESMIIPLLAQRINENVERFLQGKPVLGRVNLRLGY